MKTVCYVGEIRDYSDRKILSVLKEHFRVIIADLEKEGFRIGPCDLVINRLYGSALGRHGKDKIRQLLKKVRRIEAKKVQLINSTRGYLFDLNRIEQYGFFARHNVPFVKTIRVAQLLSAKDSITFPCVLKDNSLSRSKRLQIIDSESGPATLSGLGKGDWVLQSLVRKDTCYRTEFIGADSFTFTQRVRFQKKSLTFGYTRRIVRTPLSASFRNRLVKLVNLKGIQVFSIEYFLEAGHPRIIDFNMTSNYPRFLVDKTKGHLTAAWLNIINNAIV